MQFCDNANKSSIKIIEKKKSLLKYLFLSIFLGKGGSNDFIKNVFRTFLFFQSEENTYKRNFVKTCSKSILREREFQNNCSYLGNATLHLNSSAKFSPSFARITSKLLICPQWNCVYTG